MRKHCSKGKNASNQHFSPFPTIFSTLSKTDKNLITYNLLSANASKFVKSKKLLFGKE